MRVHTIRYKAEVFSKNGTFYLYLPEKDEDGVKWAWQEKDEVLVTIEWQKGPTCVPKGKAIEFTNKTCSKDQ